MYVLYDLGVIAFVIATDSTYISLLILLLFTLCSLFIAYRNWRIAKEYEVNDWLNERCKKGQDRYDLICLLSILNARNTHTANYLLFLLQNKTDVDISQRAELYAEALAGPHKIGWFVSGVLIKLGLLGTVIGFVIMLGTVANLEQLDISGVKQLMQQMTQGMGIAMYTTMTGLIASLLLSLQCLMLERSTDKLVLKVVDLGQKLYLADTELAANKAPIGGYA